MKKGILLALTIVFSLYSQDSLSLESIAERVLADSPVDSVFYDSATIDTATITDSVDLDEQATDSTIVDTNTVVDTADSIDSTDESIIADVVTDSLDTLAVAVEETVEEDTVITAVTTSDTVIENDSIDAVTSASPMIYNTPIGIVLIVISFLAVLFAIYLKFKRGQSSNKFLTQTRISVMDREVQIICGHIEEKFAQKDLTAQTVCEAVSTGVSFAEGLFSKELDMTIDEFIAHVRIHQAVDMINRGFDGEIDQLMDRCGYEVESQFESDFIDITGVEVKKLLKDVE